MIAIRNPPRHYCAIDAQSTRQNGDQNYLGARDLARQSIGQSLKIVYRVTLITL